MAELRLMKNDDIAECVELYMGAFPHEGKVGEVFRENLPPYFESYIANDYCMAYVLEDRERIVGLLTAAAMPSIGETNIYIDTVAVLPACQHKGCGTQMMNDFIKMTHEKFYSVTAMRSANGYKLYSKVGFAEATDCSFMLYIPGVTQELNMLRAERKALKDELDRINKQ